MITKHICLYGGPSSGKSTTATGLFHQLKLLGKNCEYVPEYAKSLVYNNDINKLNDQLLVLAKQHHPWKVLDGNVEYLIHDGPFLLSLVYLTGKLYPKECFKEIVLKMYNSYNTINFFLNRKESIEYKNEGRNESLETSIEIDNKIKLILSKNNIKYHNLFIGNDTVNSIIEIINN